MNKLAITAWTGMTVRNLFHGTVGPKLTEHFQLTILSYYGDALSKSLSYGRNRIVYQKIRNPRWNLPQLRGQFQDLLNTWEYHAMWQKYRLAGLIHIARQRETTPTRFFLNQLGGRIAGMLNEHLDTDFLRDLAYTIPISSQLSDHQGLLIATTDLPKDKSLLYSCKKAGIPVFALVHSWDNLICRGRIVAKPNRLFVWNNVMADEAMKLHNISHSTIEVVGGPQYEHYRQINLQTSSSSLRKRLMIPNAARVITYACSALFTFPDEPLLIQRLLDSISQGRFGDCFLVLRLHPSDDYSERHIAKYSSSDLPVRLDHPDAGFAAENRRSIGGTTSIENFIQLMSQSDVVINIASTISLDAALFDTPVICPRFNLNLPKSVWNSAEQIYLTDNYVPVIQSGGVDFPTNESEFYTAISLALEYPERLAEGRNKLVQSLIPNLSTSSLICDSIQNFI